MFNELMDRAVRSARGKSDRAELDRFRRNTRKSPSQRRWAACLNAEICSRIGRPGQAQGWINAAYELAEDGSALWQADLASCHVMLELAFDEPQRAFEWAYQAWGLHLDVGGKALSDQKALDELLADVEVLFIELCDIASADADTNPALLRAAWMKIGC